MSGYGPLGTALAVGTISPEVETEDLVPPGMLAIPSQEMTKVLVQFCFPSTLTQLVQSFTLTVV